LALNSSTDVISGIPTTAGTSNFKVQVADSASGKTSRASSLVKNRELTGRFCGCVANTVFKLIAAGATSLKGL
jgi:hypothetical protein